MQTRHLCQYWNCNHFLKIITLGKSIPCKWWNEIPPPLPLNGIFYGTKLRHKKRLFFSGQSFIRLWQFMSGVGKFQQRLTKVAPIVAHSRWNQWNTCSSVVLLLNKGGNMLLISCANSLPKEGTLAHGNLSSWCNAFFYQPLCKMLKWFNCIWFFLRSGLLWIIRRQRNDLVFNTL